MNSPSAIPTTPATLMPRRDFLKTSAGLAATATLARPLTAAERKRSIGANDRIRIAQIGCGNRGQSAHMTGVYKHVKETNFEYVAVADTWRVHREQAAAKAKEWFGKDVKQFASYKDVLAMKDVDAVMIATPDHLHTTHLEAAAKAGKHIYIEKPLATEFDKLVRAVDAVKAAGTVVQCGTQLRSYPGIVGAREVMRSGILGKVSKVEENRNGTKPYWYQYLERDVKEADVDWKAFLGDRPMRKFNPEMYAAWYGHYDFCQGPVPQWGAHFLDTVHYILDSKFPESCMCTGGVLTWKDEHKFTTPDCVSATWMYPEGYMITSANNFGNGGGSGRKIFAANGTMDIQNTNAPSYSADGGLKRGGEIRGKVEVPLKEHPDHFLNWLQCMRTGETPNASIEAGYLHAVAVLMAVVSYETGKKTVYDSTKRALRTV
ncbi:MAG: Gfo/Idh/MocA family oxidoreductase [Opitutaceae bacterium]|nr:Gfo/Idh/MocA family oxidoreductase [Opitutaceae bacterium]